jgi:hypothetical protein
MKEKIIKIMLGWIENNEPIENTADKLLDLFAVISWVAVSDKLPTVEDNGQKVLIYRIMNDSQSSLAISIHETNMVKHCNPNETWWMELPEPPCL